MLETLNPKQSALYQKRQIKPARTTTNLQVCANAKLSTTPDAPSTKILYLAQLHKGNKPAPFFSLESDWEAVFSASLPKIVPPSEAPRPDYSNTDLRHNGFCMADEIHKQAPMPSRLVPEHPSNATIVQKHFGRFIIAPTKPEVKDWQPQFPALSNDVYGHLGARKESVTGFDGAAWVKQNLQDEELARRKALEETKGKRPSFAGQLAQTIDWSRPTYGDEDELIFKFDDHAIAIAENIHAWVMYLDSKISRGINPFDYCNVCGQNHIIDGPPYTIADRDDCGSLLPDWFRSVAKNITDDKYSRPWDVFIRLLNDIAQTEEIEAGYGKDPNALSKWDKNYHEANREWGHHRRNGGWWKCRSRMDGNANDRVPPGELNCQLCHVPKCQTYIGQEKQRKLLKDKTLDLRQLMTEHMKLVMEQDQAVVLGHLMKERRWSDDNLFCGMQSD